MPYQTPAGLVGLPRFLAASGEERRYQSRLRYRLQPPAGSIYPVCSMHALRVIFDIALLCLPTRRTTVRNVLHNAADAITAPSNIDWTLRRQTDTGRCCFP